MVDSVLVGGETYTTDNYTGVKLKTAETVINIYYTTEINNRTKMPYEIHYFYRDGSWAINEDGKYEYTANDYAEDSSKIETGFTWKGKFVTAPDKDENGKYVLDKVTVNDVEQDSRVADLTKEYPVKQL